MASTTKEQDLQNIQAFEKLSQDIHHEMLRDIDTFRDKFNSNSIQEKIITIKQNKASHDSLKQVEKQAAKVVNDNKVLIQETVDHVRTEVEKKCKDHSAKVQAQMELLSQEMAALAKEVDQIKGNLTSKGLPV